MKKLNLLILLCFLFGCSTRAKGEIKPEYDMFLSEFKEFSKITDQDYYEYLSMDFKEIEPERPGVVGLCYDDIYKQEIFVDRDFWNHSDYASKQAVIWHEIGHCVCKLEHTDQKQEETFWQWVKSIFSKKEKTHFKDGCPVSMMNSSIPTFDCLYKYQEHYKKDLRQKCQKSLRKQ